MEVGPSCEDCGGVPHGDGECSLGSLESRTAVARGTFTLRYGDDLTPVRQRELAAVKKALAAVRRRLVANRDAAQQLQSEEPGKRVRFRGMRDMCIQLLTDLERMDPEAVLDA